MRMNLGKTMVAWLWGGVVLGGSAGAGFADTKETGYAIIPERNAFALKPIPPPAPPPTNAPPAPPTTVKLTGITTILTTPRVLLEYTEQGKQPQKPILSVGQRDGPIEVLEIDE